MPTPLPANTPIPPETEAAFLTELQALCHRHGWCVVPTHEREADAHDPMGIVPYDEFWQDYYANRIYTTRDLNPDD